MSNRQTQTGGRVRGSWQGQQKKKWRKGNAQGKKKSRNETRVKRTRTTGGLIEVDIDALELEVRVAVVGAGRVDSVLVANHLPELGTNLVAALTSLDVDDLTHGGG